VLLTKDVIDKKDDKVQALLEEAVSTVIFLLIRLSYVHYLKDEPEVDGWWIGYSPWTVVIGNEVEMFLNNLSGLLDDISATGRDEILATVRGCMIKELTGGIYFDTPAACPFPNEDMLSALADCIKGCSHDGDSVFNYLMQIADEAADIYSKESEEVKL
jgi:hypothetical protein